MSKITTSETFAVTDELMALCDQFESELKSRTEVAKKFAFSVVSAA